MPEDASRVRRQKSENRWQKRKQQKANPRILLLCRAVNPMAQAICVLFAGVEKRVVIGVKTIAHGVSGGEFEAYLSRMRSCGQ